MKNKLPVIMPDNFFSKIFLAILAINTFLISVILFVIIEGPKLPGGRVEIVPSVALVADKFTPERKQELKELKNKAHALITGEVVSAESQWNEDNTFIWTFAEIKVSNWIKDQNSKKLDILVVKVPDGRVGDITQASSDMVSFSKGEKVFLFLGKEIYKGKEYFNVLGREKGKYTIKDGNIEEFGLPVKQFLDELK